MTAKTVPEESTASAVDPERIPHVMPSKFAPEDLDLIRNLHCVFYRRQQNTC